MSKLDNNDLNNPEKIWNVNIKGVSIVEGSEIWETWRSPMYIIKTDLGPGISSTIKSHQEKYGDKYCQWENFEGKTVAVKIRNDHDQKLFHRWIYFVDEINDDFEDSDCVFPF